MLGAIDHQRFLYKMTYSVKEIFYTLQGEGAQTGRPSVFCRFAGCNLWSGVESQRASAICNFCDTDFVGTNGNGGGKFPSADELANAVSECWPNDGSGSNKYVVCTGGEPLLQLDRDLIDCLHHRGFEVAVETNGTIKAPAGIDWICVSPKGNAKLKQRIGDELKLVYPQLEVEAHPSRFIDMEFKHKFLQPMDGPGRRESLAATVQYCLDNPNWKLSIQTHKVIGIE